jgi:hypothetical protein
MGMGIWMGIEFKKIHRWIGIGLAIPFKFQSWMGIGMGIAMVLRPITHLWFKTAVLDEVLNGTF